MDQDFRQVDHRAPTQASRLFILFISLLLFGVLWALYTLSTPGESCEGWECFSKEKLPHSSPQDVMNAAGEIDPFSNEPVDQFQVDDPKGDDDDDNDDDDALPVDVFNGTDSEKDDQDTKFQPVTVGTLGYAILHSKGKLFQESNRTKLRDASLTDLDLDKGVHIITTFFHGTYHTRRFKEIMATLVSNLENPYVTAMHVLWQRADPRYFIPDDIAEAIVAKELDKKLILTEVQSQPTYKRMFTYANENLKRGAVAIVTNADIYYDSSIECVTLPPTSMKTLYYHPEEVKYRSAIALSRRHAPECGEKPDHHSKMDLCMDYSLSHDAFIFAPPIPNSIVKRTDHTQNAGYGAENIVIFEFKRENFKVLNPCFTVKGFHLHCVSERHYAVQFVNRSPPRPGASFPIKRKCGTIWVY